MYDVSVMLLCRPLAAVSLPAVSTAATAASAMICIISNVAPIFEAKTALVGFVFVTRDGP
jgi:hypothetical protein